MSTILIVEDDDHVADLIKKGLREDGYKVLHTIDGIAGMDLLAKEDIELVVLDILLPKMNGLEVCRKIKTEGYAHLPILMLTALGSAENVVLGLDSGADDYLAKPFKLIELKARVRTLLRRKKISTATSNDHSAIYRFAEIELNDNTKMVTRNGKEMSLTSTEYRLLMMFLKNPKMVLSRSSILDEIWGINFDIGTNVVDVYVNYLRKKLDKLGDKKLIHTVIGMGYILKDS